MNPSEKNPKVTVLPESAAIPFNDSTRCLYRFANGKRCRLTGSQPHFGSALTISALPSPLLPWSCITMRKTSLPTSSPNFPSSLPPLISANFSPVSSLSSPKAASRLAALPFSLISPISSSTLTPALVPERIPPPGTHTGPGKLAGPARFKVSTVPERDERCECD